MAILGHWLPRPIGWAKGTEAAWAVNSPDTLIVFVHGFNGKAKATWNDFPALIPNEPKFHAADIIYYGYDGVFTQATISAVELRKHLEGFLKCPVATFDDSVPDSRKGSRNGWKGYDKVVLVGHSLGAVICRLVLLFAHRKHKDAGSSTSPWPRDVKLILFAPAHLGTDVANLAAQLVAPIPVLGNLLAPLAKSRAQVVRDLEIDSPTLKDLRECVKEALAGGADQLVANTVAFGVSERVVVTNVFCADPTPDVVDGHNHTSVCKPTNTFKTPIEFIERVL